MKVLTDSQSQTRGGAACLALLLTAIIVQACSKVHDASVAPVKIGDVVYVFPKSHVDGINIPPKDRLYVAVSPPGEEFQLVHASRDKHRRNWQGGDAPLVTHINDIPSDSFEKHVFPEGMTVCRTDKPSYYCGLRLEVGGAGWSVIFDRKHVANSSSIRAAAKKFLEQYGS